MSRILASVLAVVVCSVSALDSSCYSYRLSGTSGDVPACVADDVRGFDRCTLLCAVCTTPATRFAMAFNARDQTIPICDDPDYAYDPDTALDVATDALLASASSHGYYWLDDGGSETNATLAVRFLLGSMPLRDIELLFGGQYFETLDWLMEHVRLALLTRSSWGAAKAIPWDVFLEHVLPYAALDEKRDVSWRWRPRFYELFFANASSYPSLSSAAVSIAGLIPATSSLGVMVVNDALEAGSPFTWKSSTAPAYLSPHQVAETGASCTGTALVLLAAYRSVGIPARIAGCSNEYKNGAWVDDDHHWVEYWDATVAGPFTPAGGDDDADAVSWHTKEGTSKGNAGGPWDSPSSSMSGCLAKMVPGDNMATLWASSWSSGTFFPTMWHNDSWASSTGFVGGYNACGRYCSAWGCGNGSSMDQVNFYSQEECGPTSQ